MFKVGDKVKRKPEHQSESAWKSHCRDLNTDVDSVFTVSGIDSYSNKIILKHVGDYLFDPSKFELYVEPTESSEFTQEDEALLQKLIQRKAMHEVNINFKKSLIGRINNYLKYDINEYTRDELERLHESLAEYLNVTRPK